MTKNRQRLLRQARFFGILLACGVILLSAQSLLTGQKIYQDYALGLGFFGLLAMSLIVSRIIKTEE